MEKITNFIKSIKTDSKKMMITSIVVAVVIIVGALMYTNSGGASFSLNIFGESPQAIAQKSIDYINNNQLSQTPATLVAGSVSQESGLVKFKIDIGGNSFDSYATKDGKLLFPQVFVMDQAPTPAN